MTHSAAEPGRHVPGDPHAQVLPATGRALLRPGGRYGFTAWADASRALGFALVLEAVKRHGRPVTLPPGPDFFRFSEAAECTAVLEAAGFVGASVRHLDLRWRLESPDDLFPAFHLGTARTGALLRGQDEAARAEIAAALGTAAAERFGTPDGGLEVPMPALLATAMKPPRPRA